MIVKRYIKEFEKLGFCLFVHFGLYSVIGKGEWAKLICNIDDDYESVASQFLPKLDWAENLVKTAKSSGCKYITLRLSLKVEVNGNAEILYNHL
jgi:alpha-L-fucosidase